MRVLAVDPGAVRTGVVVVYGQALIRSTTLHNAGLVEHYRLGIWHLLNHILDTCDIDVVAVEDVVAPSWFMGGKKAPINPGTLIGTAAVLGVVAAAAYRHDVTLLRIPPGGNGAGPYSSYPTELVSPSERRGAWESKAAGKGAHCHERSAWDVARVAQRTAVTC